MFNKNKYISLLEEDLKKTVLGLHPALQEDIVNIILDSDNLKNPGKLNREVRTYLMELPLDLITFNEPNYYSF